MHPRYGWAVAAPIVLATGRSGGWQAGGDGSSLHQSNGDWVHIQTPSAFQDCYRQHHLALYWDPHPKGEEGFQFTEVLSRLGHTHHEYKAFLGRFPHYCVPEVRFSSTIRHLNSAIYVYLAKCQQIPLLSFRSMEVCQCSQQNLERDSHPRLNPGKVYFGSR